MKKIRLTESDLTRIVKGVILERASNYAENREILDDYMTEFKPYRVGGKIHLRRSEIDYSYLSFDKHKCHMSWKLGFDIENNYGLKIDNKEELNELIKDWIYDNYGYKINDIEIDNTFL